MRTRLILPTVFSAVGMFVLSVGLGALNVAHLGVRYIPVQWFASSTSLGYQTAAYIVAAVGFAIVSLAAEICRRADKRFVAATPGISSPHSFQFAILPGGFFALIAFALLYQRLQT